MHGKSQVKPWFFEISLIYVFSSYFNNFSLITFNTPPLSQGHAPPGPSAGGPGPHGDGGGPHGAGAPGPSAGGPVLTCWNVFAA